MHLYLYDDFKSDKDLIFGKRVDDLILSLNSGKRRSKSSKENLNFLNILKKKPKKT
jgi:hypothetical protein